MNATISAWTLSNPNGIKTRCLLSKVNGHLDVIVWNGPSIVVWERAATEDAARARADELWTLLVSLGWSLTEEPSEPSHQESSRYRRTCVECGQQSGIVTHRRQGFVVLRCESCAERWNDRERVAAQDRRHVQRGAEDRRKAA